MATQDIKVSIDQNQSDVQDLRGEVSPLQLGASLTV